MGTVMKSSPVTPKPGSKESTQKLKKRSYWGEIFHRLSKNPVAMVCLVFLTALVLVTIFARWLAPYDYSKIDLSLRYALPSLAHPMGCDEQGRDMLSRLLVGGQYSLVLSVIAVAIGIVFGMLFGAICGYFGKVIDNVLMRIMDIIMSIPGLMLTICISVALGTGVVQTAIAISAGSIPMIARMLRGSTMLVHDLEYVQAARIFGEGSGKIIMGHVIPNCLSPIIVQATMNLGSSIMAISGLAFIGLGIQEPTPEWGSILNNGLSNITMMASRWHTIVFPTIFISLTMLAFNLLGDGLRDAMDPRMRK